MEPEGKSSPTEALKAIRRSIGLESPLRLNGGGGGEKKKERGRFGSVNGILKDQTSVLWKN